MSDFDFDLFVIGGGSGGVRAARTAAATGARVALAEESRLGGTCVIRGCVPKKLMVFASGYPGLIADAQEYGWEASIGAFDWPRFRKRLHTELDRLEDVYGTMLSKSDVTLYDTRARITGAHEVTLAGGETVSAKHILVAAGGRPMRPPIQNAELGLVSNDMFLMEELPKSMLIVGGGYIGCEFACMMKGLGVDVSVYLRGGQILNGFDDECRGLVAEMMREQGIDIHTGTSIVEMERADQHEDVTKGAGSDAAMGAPVSENPHPDPDVADNPKSETTADAGCPVWVKASNGKEGTFDAVLFATGRKPNTDELGLVDVGVELGRNGEIVVDDYSQSSVPSIYAIGDVTDRVQLTPVAIREAMAFTRTVFKGEDCPVDHELIPSAVFTQPEMGTVGMTEEEAMRDHEVDVYCTSFRPMRTAFIGRPERTLLKLIVDRETDVVLGAHVVAEEAGEMIQLIGIAVKNKLTKAQFDATCAVHPTISEELVTMSQPAR
ncbi:Glutathione amide reductase [Rhodobacteraceae bacterium THAF1]|uniref:FAD-dependent oxidoreductase n=1 Tax=Palleronia sp. THAF1 TaxID=2587842 RepID=UPI000F3C19E9|nr:FAD-dependent oxidoreductase [Palleronia sp. THAF1]QFU07456.1 Glutathione amide reductase [Palleronia sp. THAF1]VDC20632.1 Glutathione amide reductase [Rhodobacteraceae bacterium THAF1]